MTVNDLISDITSLRGQQYGTDMIMGWINEIEGQVIEEVINRAEGYNLEFIPMEYEKDQDKKLSIPDRFRMSMLIICFQRLIITMKKLNAITMTL